MKRLRGWMVVTVAAVLFGSTGVWGHAQAQKQPEKLIALNPCCAASSVSEVDDPMEPDMALLREAVDRVTQ